MTKKHEQIIQFQGRLNVIDIQCFPKADHLCRCFYSRELTVETQIKIWVKGVMEAHLDE